MSEIDYHHLPASPEVAQMTTTTIQEKPHEEVKELSDPVAAALITGGIAMVGFFTWLDHLEKKSRREARERRQAEGPTNTDER